MVVITITLDNFPFSPDMARIHIRTLDTCEVNTKLPILEIRRPRGYVLYCSLAIFWEYLVFSSTSEITTLHIWNWTSGKLLLVRIVSA